MGLIAARCLRMAIYTGKKCRSQCKKKPGDVGIRSVRDASLCPPTNLMKKLIVESKHTEPVM